MCGHKGHDLTADQETWWDITHEWNALTDGYVHFRKARPTRLSSGVAFHVREQLECIEL